MYRETRGGFHRSASGPDRQRLGKGMCGRTRRLWDDPLQKVGVPWQQAPLEKAAWSSTQEEFLCRALRRRGCQRPLPGSLVLEATPDSRNRCLRDVASRLFNGTGTSLPLRGNYHDTVLQHNTAKCGRKQIQSSIGGGGAARGDNYLARTVWGSTPRRRGGGNCAFPGHVTQSCPFPPEKVMERLAAGPLAAKKGAPMLCGDRGPPTDRRLGCGRVRSAPGSLYTEPVRGLCDCCDAGGLVEAA